VKTITEQETFEDTAPRLQLERTLVPIDEFAAREGISRSAVEDWAKLGLVQTRRHKGKIFVVDVPPAPYDPCRTPDNCQQPNSRGSPPKSTTFWKTTAIVSAVCAFASILAGLWLYSDRQEILNRVTLAYEKFDKTNESLVLTKQRAEILQNHLDETKIERDQLRNQLIRSQAEVKDVRSQLNIAKKNLDSIRQYNTEAAQQLNEQIDKLTKLTDEAK
jgi:coenzyme F420-reducing hydrogenase delta subunit